MTARAWGITAMVLIRLVARHGEWVNVVELAVLVDAPLPALLAELQAMDEHGELVARRAADGVIEAVQTVPVAEEGACA
jgi:hypothetical protein